MAIYLLGFIMLKSLITFCYILGAAHYAASLELTEELLSKTDPLLSKETRIGIMGGGAAGLSAAYYLKQNGYTNVTVLEKEESVGGKCHSTSIEGSPYDLGASFITSCDLNVRELAKSLGHKFLESPDAFQMSYTDKKVSDLSNYSFFQKGMNLARGAKLYSSLVFPAVGFSGVQKQDMLSGTIDQFIKKQNLPMLADCIKIAAESYGYGPMTKQATPYALKLVLPELQSRLSSLSALFRKAQIDTLEGGYQGLLETMASKLCVKTGHTVTKILYEEKENSKKEILVSTYDSLEKTEQTFHFDKLIVAVTPDILQGLTKLDSEEQDLFSRIRYYDYHVTLFEPEKTLGYKTYINDISNKEPTVISQINAKKSLCASYQYGSLDSYHLGEKPSSLSMNSIRSGLESSLVKYLGTKTQAIKAHKQWDYFPHVTDTDIQEGFFERMEALQGKKNTYYVGSALAFEWVDAVFGYSKQLVNTKFPK